MSTLSVMSFAALISFVPCFILALILERHPMFRFRTQLVLFGVIGLVVFSLIWLSRIPGTSLAQTAGGWIGMMAGLVYPRFLLFLRRLIRRAPVHWSRFPHSGRSR